MTLLKLLELAAKRMNVPHIQDLAPWIGTDRSNISHYRAGRLCPTDIQVIKIAGMANVPPAHALIWIAHHRSKVQKAPPLVTRGWLAAKKQLPPLAPLKRAQHEEHAE